MFIVLLVVDVVLAFVMIIGGAILHYQAPLDDSRSLGIKTKRALASAETWEFANRKCGRLWMFGGAVLLILPPLAGPVWFLVGAAAGTIAAAGILLLNIGLLVGSLIATETALKRKFPAEQK